MNILRQGFFAAVLICLSAVPSSGEELLKVRIGVLKFGTVNWELDVMKHHGLDKAQGLDVEIVRLASKQATSVAFQASDVHMMVDDWFWVSRQRHMGRNFSFIPYSAASGALVVPAGSSIKTLADLKGKRLGIAGGALNRNWLLVRALAKKRYDVDLNTNVEKVFGAPPLLSQQLERGRIDAIITFWHYVARLEAKGMKKLMGIDQVSQALGIERKVPQIGYVYRQDWAKANPKAAASFMRASLAAKNKLKTDKEWERIRPLTKAKNPETLDALKRGFREGIPQSWGEAEWEQAKKLFAIIDKVGGSVLTGEKRTFAPGTFALDVKF